MDRVQGGAVERGPGWEELCTEGWGGTELELRAVSTRLAGSRYRQRAGSLYRQRAGSRYRQSAGRSCARRAGVGQSWSWSCELCQPGWLEAAIDRGLGAAIDRGLGVAIDRGLGGAVHGGPGGTELELEL